jgi:hypothetical protein
MSSERGNDRHSVSLDADNLGDPVYYRRDAVGPSKLVFTGDAADYVAGELSAARSERTRMALVAEYAVLYAQPAMPALQLHRILDEFALRLLDSSAVR